MLVKIETLKNNTKCLCLPALVDGLDFLSLFVIGGSSQESKDLLGLTHLLEHLMMESGEDSEDVIISASTSFDYIRINGQCLSQNFRTLAKAMTQRVVGLKIDYSKIKKEVSILNEEYKKKLTNPEKLLEIKTIQSVFNKTSYSNYYKKSFDHLLKLNVERVVKYASSLLEPGNLIFIYSGVLDSKQLVDILDDCFYDVKVQRQEAEHGESIFKPQPLKIVRLGKIFKPVYLTLNFLTYPPNDPHVYAIDLINEYLTRGHSARLFSVIRKEQPIAYSLRGNHAKYSRLGHYSITAVSSTPEKLINIIETELNILNKNLDKTAIEKMKARLISWQKIFYLNNPSSAFDFIAYNFATRGQIETPDIYFSKISKVSDSQLRDAIHTLDPKNMSIVRSD